MGDKIATGVLRIAYHSETPDVHLCEVRGNFEGLGCMSIVINGVDCGSIDPKMAICMADMIRDCAEEVLMEME